MKILDFSNAKRLIWDSSAMNNPDFEYYEIETWFKNAKKWAVAYHCFENNLIVPVGGCEHRIRAFYGNRYGKYEIVEEAKMAKEITAARARKITAQQILDTLWNKIFTNISDAANKGQRKALVNLDGYFNSVYSGDGFLAINPLLSLLLEDLEFRGYNCGRKPPIDTIHPEIEAWIEIEW